MVVIKDSGAVMNNGPSDKQTNATVKSNFADDRGQKVIKITRKPRWVSALFMFVSLLIASAFFIYPVVSAKYNDYLHFLRAEEAESNIQSIPEETISNSLKQAKEYNSKLTGIPILDPYLTEVNDSSSNYSEYLSILSEGSSMGRLIVPSVGINLPIYHGTEEKAISNGVGHLYGTSVPVGGDSTHSVLTSHSAMPHATLFDNLPDVLVGDKFYILIAGETLSYEVHKVDSIKPNDIESLFQREGEDLVTLFTCYPYGQNSSRYVLEAHRIPTTVEEIKEINENIDFDWFDINKRQLTYFVTGAATILIAFIIPMNEYRVHRKRRTQLKKYGTE